MLDTANQQEQIMTQQASPSIQLALRFPSDSANHHLWNNNGTWWCHFTVHGTRGTKQRVRRSLRTHDLSLARKRRDQFLARLEAATNTSQERRAA
jgi:hypothetical protein